MIHSKPCIEVISSLDFAESSYMWLEEILLKHTVKQIVSLVVKKDPDGIHEWTWFIPFFNGYVKPILNYHVDFDDNFWMAYDMICNFVDPFPIQGLELIKKMSYDIDRIYRAKIKSKPNVSYLEKVWSGLPPTFNNNSVIEIEDIMKHDVKTYDLL